MIATRLRQSVFADFYRFWRPCIFRLNLLYKRHQNLAFSALASRSGFGAGFGQEKLLSCQRNPLGFCNLVLANSIGVATSMLLCIPFAQVVLWSFATCCLQIRIGLVAPKLRLWDSDYFSNVWCLPLSSIFLSILLLPSFLGNRIRGLPSLPLPPCMSCSRDILLFHPRSKKLRGHGMRLLGPSNRHA